MKMQKAPQHKELLGKESISKSDTPIVSDFDNEAQVLLQIAKTLVSAGIKGVAV